MTFPKTVSTSVERLARRRWPASLVRTYFANIFGSTQYQKLHDGLAEDYFKAFFAEGAVVGQMRTQLGVLGMEHNGPELAARFLLEMLKIMPPRPEAR